MLWSSWGVGTVQLFFSIGFFLVAVSKRLKFVSKLQAIPHEKMEQLYTADEIFDKKNFTETALPEGEYERCTFNNCNFSNTSLRGIRFFDCTFNGCNLSLAKPDGTSLQNAIFISCKMLGIHFELCNPFLLSFQFDQCQLNDSSFYGLKIKKTSFKNTQLNDADFTGCDLTGALFENCDLGRANFDNTIVEKADFRTSFNYSIDPERNRIKKARFSIMGVAGLLDRYDIEIEGR